MNGRLTEQQRLENEVTRAHALAQVRAAYTRQPRHGPRLTIEGIALLIFAAFFVGVVALGLVVATAPYWLPAVAVLAVGVGRARSPRFAERVDDAIWQARERVVGLRPAVRYPSAAATAGAAFLAGWWALHYVLGVATALMVLAPVAYRFTRGHGGHYMHEPAPELEPADRVDGVTRDVVAALPTGRQAAYLNALAQYLPEPSLKWAPGRVTVTAALPAGFTPADVDLTRFAHAHGVQPSRVRAGATLPGHVVLEVLDTDPADMAPGEWPHLGGPTDWTKPMTLGVDDTGQPVRLNLGGGRVLVVGQSGSGKTRLMRAIALYAATDPNVRLHVIDCKGGPAFKPFRGRVDYFHAGPADTAVGAHLAGVRAEVERRYRDDVTPERAGWLVVVVDEAQSLWTVKGAAESVEFIARMGREVGVGLVIGSQTPDSKSFPQAVIGQCDTRVAMRLAADWAVQMVLQQPAPCADLPRGHAFVSLADDPSLTRVASCHVDDEQTAAHLALVPLAPSTAPTAPTAPEPAPVPEGLGLADLAAALGDDKGAPVQEVAERLGVDARAVLDAMRRHGLKTASYRVGIDSKRGLVRDHVLTKMEQENNS